MNNYVPILDHPAFIAGLLVFAMGVLLQVLRTISAGLPNFANPDPSDALTSGIYLSAWVALFAIVSLLASYMDITSTLDSTTFYEVLFWGGGHVLQFTHTVLLLVAWVWISSACGVQINLSPKVMTWLFVLVVIPVIVTPLIYLQYDVVSMEHRMAFMDLMKYGGLASTPLGLFIVWFIFKSPTCDDDKRPIKAALLSSILLFAAGGIIGFLIEGINVVIPAHYHGSIVGVTLAFMGLAYHLLPQFGYTKPTSKMAHWQPYIYGGGQLMHILGLAWSGGYGVQRKTAGAAQGLENLPEIVGMAMMGTGGGISIIGGVLFVIVMLKAFMKKQKA
ncbi:MAG: cbb3-type cytochrome c oxidase subunit I [Gammaproteobacteria bacterium]|nr:cbb3-type cytochrome c oxidase subunit I [Gammaproteobacteria bacterium]